MNQEMKADIVIIGGSTGGCAAALAAAKMGKSVILTEETDWIGGQLTSQGVPPDEHPWIEQFGCTQSYSQFRNLVREYYRRNFPLTTEASSRLLLNPGNGNVSRICHEPSAALAVIHEMLAPYVHSGQVKIFTNYLPEKAEVNGDTVLSVQVKNSVTGTRMTLTGTYFLDGTECGDLLPLANVEYVTGSESQKETGEPHALAGEADPLDMQAVTHCFAMDYVEGEDHTIPKPENYEFWRNYQASFWPDKHFSWTVPHHITLEPRHFTLFPETDLPSWWLYRRIIDKENFAPGTFVSDTTLVNWPQNDYWLGPVFEVSDEERQKHLQGAKQLSLSLLYWMQTEAPRPDGKQGYPGLRLRKDLFGTEDGLAKYPYIRESRRIKAEFTVLEQHVCPDSRGEDSSEIFFDSVGVGSYRIDLHPSTGNRNYIDISSYPFQIPLGSLIPIRVKNLLPACKNLGVTHITNGCYRLHPVELNIGESAGYLAAYCIDGNMEPREVRNNRETLEDFQKLIAQQGIEIQWPKLRSL
ncbi:FAD-dependent oxidoreductase [Metabacillus sp. Hm71]|uniref:FAD-dependent oxidoreductase n=1 Tax=Metabacillus sp. Hm71 TaxID=3450743 RepID=UPI003F42DB9B